MVISAKQICALESVAEEIVNSDFKLLFFGAVNQSDNVVFDSMCDEFSIDSLVEKNEMVLEVNKKICLVDELVERVNF